MNFLAHIFLSCGSEDLLIGNFIADFISNKEVNQYDPEVQKGIQLHREIDSYTDNHPVVRQGTHRLQPNHRKYAPVVIDILYDHLLANNWKRYKAQELKVFSKEVYKILERRMDDLPLKLKKRLPEMITGDWLTQYGTEEGMIFTLKKMDERTSFPSNFVGAMDDLKENYDLFDGEFNTLFPELIKIVESYCDC